MDRTCLRIDRRLMKRIICEEMEETRSRERPHQRLMNNVQETMIELAQSRKLKLNISKVREKRKELVSVAKSLNDL